MKKSELRKIIKEELQKINETIPDRKMILDLDGRKVKKIVVGNGVVTLQFDEEYVMHINEKNMQNRKKFKG